MALLLPYPPIAIKGQQGLLYTIVHKKCRAGHATPPVAKP